MRDTCITNQHAQLGIGGQALTIDVDLVRTNQHMTVGLQRGKLFGRRCLEARRVEIEHVDELLLHVLDHGGRGGGTGTDLLCCAQHTRQIARLTAGLRLLATVPKADLGDRYADKYCSPDRASDSSRARTLPASAIPPCARRVIRRRLAAVTAILCA